MISKATLGIGVITAGVAGAGAGHYLMPVSTPAPVFQPAPMSAPAPAPIVQPVPALSAADKAQLQQIEASVEQLSQKMTPVYDYFTQIRMAQAKRNNDIGAVLRAVPK